jgi:hypothetical protein
MAVIDLPEKAVFQDCESILIGLQVMLVKKTG